MKKHKNLSKLKMIVLAVLILSGLSAFECRAQAPQIFQYGIWSCIRSLDGTVTVQLNSIALEDYEGTVADVPEMVYAVDPNTGVTYTYSVTKFSTKTIDPDDNTYSKITTIIFPDQELTVEGARWKGLTRIVFSYSGTPCITLDQEAFAGNQDLTTIETYCSVESDTYSQIVDDPISPAFRNLPKGLYRDCAKLDVINATLWPQIETIEKEALIGPHFYTLTIPKERGWITSNMINKANIDQIEIERSMEPLMLRWFADEDAESNTFGKKGYTDNIKILNIGRTISDGSATSSNIQLCGMTSLMIDCDNFTNRLVFPEALTTVSITSNVKSLESGSFAYSKYNSNHGCENLENVFFEDSDNFPAQITEIPTNCFNRCNKLWNIWIPRSVKVIGPGAFYGVESLNLYVPGNVETMYSSSVADARVVTFENIGTPIKIYVDDPSNVSATDIRPGKATYLNRGVEVATKSGSFFEPVFKNIDYLEIGNVGTKLPANNAPRFTDKVKSVYFVGGMGEADNCNVEQIGENAFHNLQMKNFRLPDSLKELQYFTYNNLYEYDCKVEVIELGTQLESVSCDSFDDCPKLHTIVIGTVVPPYVDGDFGGGYGDIDPSTVKLVVPSSSFEAYRAANGWSAFFTDKVKLTLETQGTDNDICFFANIDAEDTGSETSILKTQNKENEEEMVNPIFMKSSHAAAISKSEPVRLAFTVPGSDIESITLNGVDVRNQLQGNKIMLTLNEDSHLKVGLKNGTTGIGDIPQDTNDFKAVEWFSIDGNRVGSDAKGMIIERDKFGNVRKVIK